MVSLQDRFGKPVAFRERVAAAKAVVVQVSSISVLSKDGGVALAVVGGLADQIQYLASKDIQVQVIVSGEDAKSAAHAMESMLKLKEPLGSVPVSAQHSDQIAIAPGPAALVVYLSLLPGVSSNEGHLLKVYRPDTPLADGSASSTPAALLAAAARECAEKTGSPVVAACTLEADVLLRVLAGQDIGTLFDTAAAAAVSGEQAVAAASGARDMAVRARAASRKLQAMSSEERTAVLRRVADALVQNQEAILAANQQDVEEAQGKVADALLQRLILKPAKISQLADGIRAIADQEEPVGKLLRRMEVAHGLVLDKITSPIGVLLIIFESRPDALPQIASLAIRSGNGLLLKGGKEAVHSNSILHRIIVETIGAFGPDLISLVQTREEIDSLLALDDVIDLVIPRGSNSLVSYIQRNTKIPVLGHADGICHIYVDEDADLATAVRICVDAKVDYPAACNAVEKVLVHRAWQERGGLQELRQALQEAGVEVYGGERSASSLALAPAPSMRHEYSALACTLEVVDSMADAIEHIHRYGSAHTDCIVTRDGTKAEAFLRGVDSACVFHNASTRFADGFRFGLGAEVGISTSRIHARGPVGVEGLLTTKWVLRGDGHVVAKDKGVDYLHKAVPLAGGDCVPASGESQRRHQGQRRPCVIM